MAEKAKLPAKTDTQHGDNGGDIEDDRILYHAGRMARQEDKIANERKVLAKLKKQATTDGVVLKTLKDVRKMMELSAETNIEEMRRQQRYMQIFGMPVGHQFNIFDNPETDSTQKGVARLEGRRAAIFGLSPADNPYSGESTDGQAWLDGFGDGAKVHSQIAGEFLEVVEGGAEQATPEAAAAE